MSDEQRKKTVPIKMSAQIYANGDLTLNVPLSFSQEDSEALVRREHLGEIIWQYGEVVEETEQFDSISYLSK